MDLLYVILYLLAALCFLVEGFRPNKTPPGWLGARVSFLSLGLLFWVMVPLIVSIRRL